MAKNRNTFQKMQREMEKKRKANQKRDDKLRKKEFPAPPIAAAGESRGDDAPPD